QRREFLDLIFDDEGSTLRTRCADTQQLIRVRLAPDACFTLAAHDVRGASHHLKLIVDVADLRKEIARNVRRELTQFAALSARYHPARWRVDSVGYLLGIVRKLSLRNPWRMSLLVHHV